MGLAALSALLYNTWILGLFLNPKVLHNAYFSVLNVRSNPYAWVFILADVTAASMVFIVSLMLRATKPRRIIWVGYMVFSVATLAEALIPISNRCVESVSACGIALSQVLSPHDIVSITATTSLFIVLLMIRRQVRTDKINPKLIRLLSWTFWLFCASAIFLVTCVVADAFTTIAQAFFVISSGLALVVIPASVLRLSEYNNYYKESRE